MKLGLLSRVNGFGAYLRVKEKTNDQPKLVSNADWLAMNKETRP